jgi:hypothetical protein
MELIIAATIASVYTVLANTLCVCVCVCAHAYVCMHTFKPDFIW